MEYIEGGWPGSNPKDAEFFSVCKLNIEKSKKNTKLAAFGATRRKGSVCHEVSFIVLWKQSIDIPYVICPPLDVMHVAFAYLNIWVWFLSLGRIKEFSLIFWGVKICWSNEKSLVIKGSSKIRRIWLSVTKQ